MYNVVIILLLINAIYCLRVLFVSSTVSADYFVIVMLMPTDINILGLFRLSISLPLLLYHSLSQNISLCLSLSHMR